jgi:hypothetical protein
MTPREPGEAQRCQGSARRCAGWAVGRRPGGRPLGLRRAAAHTCCCCGRLTELIAQALTMKSPLGARRAPATGACARASAAPAAAARGSATAARLEKKREWTAAELSAPSASTAAAPARGGRAHTRKASGLSRVRS